MAHKNEHLLDTLCPDAEIKSLALAYLRTATVKTAQGSGHTLPGLTTGLPAACAFLASEKLISDKVTEKQAQVSACLRPSEFRKVLDTVRIVLQEEDEKKKRNKRRTGLSYETLYLKYSLDITEERMKGFYHTLENTLRFQDSRHNPESPEVKCAIFSFICTTLKIKGFPTSKKFCEENKVDLKTFSAVLKELNAGGPTVKARIIDKMKETPTSPKKATTITTPRQSPSKRILREPPTKDSPKKRPATPEPEPTQENHDAEMAPPETPVKRRKLESPSKPTLRSAPSKPTLRSSPVKPIFPATASASSSSKVTLDLPSTRSVSKSPTRPQPDRSTARLTEPEPSPVRRKPGRPPARASTAMDVDTQSTVAAVAAPSSSESEEEEEDAPPRRFRPVYLDHEQWGSRDPRIARLWRQGERHKKAMVDLYGHPFARYRPKVVEVEV